MHYAPLTGIVTTRLLYLLLPEWLMHCAPLAGIVTTVNAIGVLVDLMHYAPLVGIITFIDSAISFWTLMHYTPLAGIVTNLRRELYHRASHRCITRPSRGLSH